MIGNKEEIENTVKRRRKYLIIIAIIFMMNWGLFSYVDRLLGPVNTLKSEDKVIEVEPGSSVVRVSNKLYENQLIRSPMAFKFYIKLKGLATEIQAGYYRLNSKMPATEIAEKLVKGQVATYSITIPEGKTIEEIGQVLAKHELDEEKFLSLAKNKEVVFIKSNPKVKYNLEGFLFPETYQIPYGANEEEIIDIMLKEFERKISLLKDEIKESKYNLEEIITIASLIQAESKLDQEGPLVASVIYNRLNKNMKLQLDATVQYSLSKRKSRLLYSDLKVDTPYNTYKNYGLPPGPINNPGIEAIKSALDPKETNYLYYVLTTDGKHRFTESYKEHLQVQNRLNNK
ncbi:endolytic transglycosylase MltG [Orenia marismortui]|uniref:endolytic transglycosylase MltG n=1 Tax=Orenia marismortui TaxID=46469 RepID=UPI00037643C2|nr:endolytic transglycosylase MltG [Orenia marismortui]